MAVLGSGSGPSSPANHAVGLPDAARRQGQSLTVHLTPECEGATTARTVPNGDEPVGATGNGTHRVDLADSDSRTDTFTVDTGVLAIGTHVVEIDCRNDLTARTSVLVYRQNGAARGEANSIVLTGGLALASTVVLIGRPGGPALRRRRRDKAVA